MKQLREHKKYSIAEGREKPIALTTGTRVVKPVGGFFLHING